jgi:hypothetical protein
MVVYLRLKRIILTIDMEVLGKGSEFKLSPTPNHRAIPPF